MATMYGADLPADADRRTARRDALATTAWQLRVLAGWLPPNGGVLARLAAAPIEIVNIEQHLARLGGSAPLAPIPIGSLGTAWPGVAAATSIEQVRTALARTAWGDPGATDRAGITLGLRVAWARRVARAVPAGREWAHGALASLIARERFVFGREINDVTGRNLDRLIGARWRDAATVPELADRLPASASWALAGIDSSPNLWRSETAIVHRVMQDARHGLASGKRDRDTVAAIMALLLIDLWRVIAAIEASGRGPAAAEVLHAVA